MEANQSLNTQVLELGGTDISPAHPVLTSIWAVSPALDGQLTLQSTWSHAQMSGLPSKRRSSPCGGLYR